MTQLGFLKRIGFLNRLGVTKPSVWIGMVSFGVIGGWSAPALATTTSSCNVTANFPSPAPVIDYDPFTSAIQRSGMFAIGLTVPETAPGQPRIRSVDYQFLDTNSSVQPQLGGDGAKVEIVRGGRSILRAGTAADFTMSSTYNTLNIPNNSNAGTGDVGFLVADGRQDLAAGVQSEGFDLAYRCNYSDGTTAEGVLANVLNASVSTQYLVRATVVGGGTTKTLTIDPDRRSATGGMAVRSTGPFHISLDSINNLSLRPVDSLPSASLPANQILPYEVRIGQDIMTPTSPPKVCARSGLGGSVLRINTRLAPSLNLQEVRAGNYSDVLTITVTPDVSGAGTPSTCNGVPDIR